MGGVDLSCLLEVGGSFQCGFLLKIICDVLVIFKFDIGSIRFLQYICSTVPVYQHLCYYLLTRLRLMCKLCLVAFSDV